MKKTVIALLGALLGLACAGQGAAPVRTPSSASTQAPTVAARRCFILREIGTAVPALREGEICAERFSPASTFTLRMFCFGGSGHVANAVNAQGGL
jgi:hypothetical protein